MYTKLRVLFSARKFSVLYRHIATYALALALPILLLGLLLFSSAMRQISEKYVQVQQVKLAQAVRELENEISALPQMVNEVLTISTIQQNVFRPYYWKKSKYNYVYAVWELGKIKRYSSLLQECMIVYREEDAVLTSNSYDNITHFFQYVYLLSGEDNLLANITTSDRASLSPAAVSDSTTNQHFNALVYIYPFKMDRVTSYNTAMVFVISEDLFGEMIDRVMGTDEYSLVLYQNGEPVLRAGGFGGLAGQQTGGFLSGDDTCMQCDVNGYTVSAIKMRGSNYDFNYVLEVPWDQQVQQAADFRKLFIAIAAATLLIGLILVVLFSYFNYIPLKKTLERLKKQQPSFFSEPVRDEYEQLDQAIRSTVSRNKSLEEHFNTQNQQFIHDILSALLTGSIRYENLEHALYILPALPGPYYCVLALHAEAGGKDALAALAQRVSSAPFPYNKTMPLVMPGFQCVAVVVNLKGDDDGFLGHVDALLRHLSDGFTVYAGVSQPCDSAGGLSHCMTEALLAMYDILDSGEAGFRSYGMSLDNVARFTMPPDDFVYALTQSIKRGDAAQALSDMRRAVAAVDRNRNPIIRQVLYFDIANIILKTFNEMRLSSAAFEVDFLQVFQDISAFQRNIELIIRDICDIVNRQSNGAGPDLFQNMLQYIEEHYLEYDFSLELLSSRYGTSMTALSRLFKSRARIGFRDYLIRKRIAASKQMLCSTDMPVGAVASAVGYTSESYFINIFKRIENMTPSEFRRKYKSITAPDAN